MILDVVDVDIQDMVTSVFVTSERLQHNHKVRVLLASTSIQSLKLINILPPSGAILFNLNGTPSLSSASAKALESVSERDRINLIKELKSTGSGDMGALSSIAPGNWNCFSIIDSACVDNVLSLLDNLGTSFPETYVLFHQKLDSALKEPPYWVVQLEGLLSSASGVESLLELGGTDSEDLFEKLARPTPYMQYFCARICSNLDCFFSGASPLSIASLRLATRLKWLTPYRHISIAAQNDFYPLLREEIGRDDIEFRFFSERFIEEMETKYSFLCESFLLYKYEPDN